MEGRTTSQGLVGVLIQKNIGAMVEVNCETDFVARNEHFQQFVTRASKACLQYVNDLPESDLYSRTEFQSESLKNLVSEDGKKLSDELALTIGSVGENATLRRAVCFKVGDAVQLIGMSYPNAKNQLAAENEVQLGSYGTLIALRSSTEIANELKKNLSLHIIGMNPQKLGNKNKDKPSADKDDESCLIYQEYLFDPDVAVGDLLAEEQIEILDYQRFKCGENVQSEEGVSAATVTN